MSVPNRERCHQIAAGELDLARQNPGTGNPDWALAHATIARGYLELAAQLEVVLHGDEARWPGHEEDE